MFRVVMTKFNETKRLPSKLSVVRMDRLKMINVFRHGQRVKIRVNGHPLGSFIAPCTQNIDIMFTNDVLNSNYIILNSNHMKLTCVPDVTTFVGLEASFRVNLSSANNDDATSKQHVALASIRCNANLFELGERYYLLARGTSSDFFAHGISHPHAIYSFFGCGSIRLLDEIPKRIHYFPHVGDVGPLCIVDHANRVVHMNTGDKCVVTLNVTNESGNIVGQTHVIRNNCPFEPVEDFTARHIVVITDNTDIFRTLGTRIEVELIQLKTAPLFRPRSCITIELAGRKKLCSVMTDSDGTIDVCLDSAVVCRETSEKLSFAFVDWQTDELVKHADGKFEAVFYVRIIDR